MLNLYSYILIIIYEELNIFKLNSTSKVYSGHEVRDRGIFMQETILNFNNLLSNFISRR